MQWTHDGARLTALGKCLDLEANGKVNGTRLHMWECHAGTSQHWERTAEGQYRNPASGRCLDVA
jgi:hypothetical protein